jgi:hypothetical protein
VRRFQTKSEAFVNDDNGSVTSPLPRQHRRCTIYPWCIGHLSPGDREHRGKAHVVPAQEGRELRLELYAMGDEPPKVSVEVFLVEGEPSLDVVELDAVQALQLAATLRQFAVESQERVQQS